MILREKEDIAFTPLYVQNYVKKTMKLDWHT